jgi:protein TonB
VWLSVPCVVSRLVVFLVLRPRRNRTLSRNLKERRQSTGPAPPASVPSATASWQRSLLARLAKVQRYPAQARGVQGVVSLAFTMDRHGKVVSSRIVTSSGSAVLDAEALDLIKRAAPLPPPPADIADSDLSFVVPIRFAAR